MGWLKSLVWPLIKAQIQAWLINRALVLPAVERAALLQLMAQAPSDSAKLELIESTLKARVLSELDKFKP